MIKIGELKFNDSPEETFNVIILDTIFIFRQRWNTIGFWTLDVLAEDSTPIVLGARIVSGTPILEQFPGVPFDLLNESTIDPTRDGINEYTLGVYEK